MDFSEYDRIDEDALNRTGRESGAIRELPPDRSRTGYAFKVSLSIDLLSSSRTP